MPSQNEIRETITADLIALLKMGTKPWQKPWSSDPNCSGLPRSISTGKAYSGINTIVLQASAMARGYTSPIWGTYQAFAKAGGQVRRRPDSVPAGRWATTAIYFNQIERKTTDDEGQTKTERWPLMKVFSLFNLEQVDGAALDHLRPGRADAAEVVPDFAHAEEVLQATGAEVRFGGDRAFYKRPIGDFPNHTGGDFIQLPAKGQFHTPADLMTTWGHELGHWSECRLNWKGSYALGELQAELCSVYLAGALNIPLGDHMENHAAYLAAWIKEMESDNKAIFRAAAQASKAADLILSFSRQPQDEPDALEVAHSS